MKQKIISYSLFETKNIQQRLHRDWDIHRTEQDRYWYNIPAMYIANSIIYPDFTIKFYISENITTHPLYKILTRLNKQDNFKLILIKNNYNNTEPTMWRMIPMWEDTDILLCRDVDSLPTIREVLATKSFIESDYSIHTMRTHKNHNAQATRMLAGLCGFKSNTINKNNIIKVKSFSEYYKFSTGGWGCDQNTLIDIFYNKIDDKKKHFMDSPLSSSVHPVNENVECGGTDFDSYDYKCQILDYIDSSTIWSGEPIEFRKDKLVELLKHDYPECKLVSDILNNDSVLKEFYL